MQRFLCRTIREKRKVHSSGFLPTYTHIVFLAFAAAGRAIYEYFKWSLHYVQVEGMPLISSVQTSNAVA